MPRAALESSYHTRTSFVKLLRTFCSAQLKTALEVIGLSSLSHYKVFRNPSISLSFQIGHQVISPAFFRQILTELQTEEMSTDSVQANPTRILFRQREFKKCYETYPAFSSEPRHSRIASDAQRLYDTPKPHTAEMSETYRELYEDHLVFLLLASQAKRSKSATAFPELRPQLKGLLDRSEDVIGSKACISLYPGWACWRQIANGGMGWNQEQKVLNRIQEVWTPVLHGLFHLGQGHSIEDTAALVDQKWKELEIKRHNGQRRLP